jgi:hypothetical protein
MKHGLILLALLLPVSSIADTEMNQEELEHWFNEDSAREDTSSISEGELRLLEHASVKQSYISRNWFSITPASFDTGLVRLRQCHQDLDPVPALEIVYRYQRIQNLAIESATAIGKARVVNNTIQLQDVQKHAALCITAEVGILYHNRDADYVLVNGPYHRQFLDGFYPMQVILDVSYPAELAMFIDSMPPVQPGVRLQHTEGRVVLDVLFEGRLNTRLRFRRRQ